MTPLQKRIKQKQTRLLKLSRRELARRIPQDAGDIRAGKWDQSPALRECLSDVETNERI